LLFWNDTWHGLAVGYQHCRTAYHSHLEWSSIPRRMGPIRYPTTMVANYQPMPRNIPEEWWPQRVMSLYMHKVIQMSSYHPEILCWKLKLATLQPSGGCLWNWGSPVTLYKVFLVLMLVFLPRSLFSYSYSNWFFRNLNRVLLCYDLFVPTYKADTYFSFGFFYSFWVTYLPCDCCFVIIW